MQRKSDDIRKRIRVLSLEIAELQMTARRRFTRAVAQAIASRQAERTGLKLLLWSRHSQVDQKIVDLATWRDGHDVKRQVHAA